MQLALSGAALDITPPIWDRATSGNTFVLADWMLDLPWVGHTLDLTPVCWPLPCQDGKVDIVLGLDAGLASSGAT